MPSPSRLPPGSKGTGESRTGSTSVRDVVFDEDRHQLRTRNGPEIMAALRNLTTRPHPPGPRRPSRYRLHHQIPVTTTKTRHQAHHPVNHLTRLCRPLHLNPTTSPTYHALKHEEPLNPVVRFTVMVHLLMGLLSGDKNSPTGTIHHPHRTRPTHTTAPTPRITFLL